MKLTLEHLAPYLPYSVRYKAIWISSFKNQPDTVENRIMNTGNIGTLYKKRYKLRSAKPILHPLSDLTKEIEMKGVKFMPINIFSKHDQSNLLDLLDDMQNDESMTIDLLPYYIIKYLIEWHFDIFGLIESGLAININEL